MRLRWLWVERTEFESLLPLHFQKPLFLSGFFVIQYPVKASDFFALPPSLARFFPAGAAPGSG